MNATEMQRANRRAAIRWGSFVIGLLGLQVAGGIVAIILATGDESVAIVPNYHQKALDWDTEMAAQAASVALGWQCELQAIDRASMPAGLRIDITNQQRMSVAVQSGMLTFYHHARAANVRQVPIPMGQFAKLELADCFDSAGVWQVMLELNCENGDKFLHSQELWVAPPEAVPPGDLTAAKKIATKEFVP